MTVISRTPPMNDSSTPVLPWTDGFTLSPKTSDSTTHASESQSRNDPPDRSGLVVPENSPVQSSAADSDSWNLGERWSLSPLRDISSRRVVYLGDLVDDPGFDSLLDLAHRLHIGVDVVATSNPKADNYRLLSKLNLDQVTGGDIFHGDASIAEQQRLVDQASGLFVPSRYWFEQAMVLCETLADQSLGRIGILDFENQISAAAESDNEICAADVHRNKFDLLRALESLN